MKAILPTNYIFNTQNVLTPNRTILGIWDKHPAAQVLGIFALISLVLAIFCFVLMKIFHNKSSNSEDTYGFMAFMSGGLGGILLILTFIIGTAVSVTQQNPAYNLNCDFKLHKNSNLIVRQDKSHRPFESNEDSAYPYRLYVKNNANTNQLIYLGQTNTQKEIFLDGSSKTSKLFASYCNYVQKHHLADKFKQKLYFTRDNSVTDANGISQYVLKGNDITLKMKPKEHNKYQIYAVNE